MQDTFPVRFGAVGLMCPTQLFAKTEAGKNEKEENWRLEVPLFFE